MELEILYTQNHYELFEVNLLVLFLEIKMYFLFCDHIYMITHIQTDFKMKILDDFIHNYYLIMVILLQHHLHSHL